MLNRKLSSGNIISIGTFLLLSSIIYAVFLVIAFFFQYAVFVTHDHVQPVEYNIFWSTVLTFITNYGLIIMMSLVFIFSIVLIIVGSIAKVIEKNSGKSPDNLIEKEAEAQIQIESNSSIYKIIRNSNFNLFYLGVIILFVSQFILDPVSFDTRSVIEKIVLTFMMGGLIWGFIKTLIGIVRGKN